MIWAVNRARRQRRYLTIRANPLRVTFVTRRGFFSAIVNRYYGHVLARLLNIFIRERKGFRNHVVHIVVLIKPQPAAENYVFMILRELAVFFVPRAVRLVVYGIEPFLARLPVVRIFARYYRERAFVAPLEMLMLDYAGIGHFSFGVIDNGVALVIGLFEPLGFEPQRTVFEVALGKTEKLVDCARVQYFIGKLIEVFSVGEVVDVEPYPPSGIP